jgi:hypothetical protein
MDHMYPYDTRRFLNEALGPTTNESLEEVLVPDARAGLTPADMVERKLLSLLRGSLATSRQTGMRASEGG